MKEKMISFRPDAGLMYLIQQVTGQSTDEILGFFYDFGKQVMLTGIDNMKPKQRSIRKDIQDIYPGTCIPFKLFVEASERWSYDTDEDEEDDSPKSRKKRFGGEIYVMFPDNPTYMDTEKLMEMIMEQQILGGSGLPPFEKPKSRTPRMYKDLIDQVVKGIKRDETVLHSGHSRETGPSGTTLDGSDGQS